MWISFFLFPGLSFWILCSIISILFIWSLEEEWYGLLISISIISAALFGLFGQLPDVIKFLYMNPLVAIEGIIGYFVIGALYSILKWTSYISCIRRNYYKMKCEFLDSKKIQYTERNPSIPENFKREWISIIDSNQPFHNSLSYSEEDKVKMFAKNDLKASKHKGQITIWIIWWVWSAAWTLINDPVKRIANEIYIALSKVYEGIVKKMHGKIENDFVQKTISKSERSENINN